jgi:hypothetical protein
MWKVFFGLEIVVILGSIMNLGVPGNYHQFWESESFYLAIAASLAIFSSFLERHETKRDGRKPIGYLKRVQIWSLVIPLGLWLFGTYAILMHFK